MRGLACGELVDPRFFHSPDDGNRLVLVFLNEDRYLRVLNIFFSETVGNLKLKFQRGQIRRSELPKRGNVIVPVRPTRTVVFNSST